MLIGFFHTLRAAGLPVTVPEFLSLLQALRDGVLDAQSDSATGPTVDGFYLLARTVLVKDETRFDTFDRAFAAYVHGMQAAADAPRNVPADWLRTTLDGLLTPDQRAAATAMEWDALMATLQLRLAEQTERHAGGSKWIGTGGTSPFGHGGFNPQGVRIGGPGGERRAVKVWDDRAFRDHGDTQELGTRTMKLALRRLRRFARSGSALELDLPGTVHGTAANAGLLDIRMVPERRNNVKVLLLMDVGGSMDAHVHTVEALFSAARSEFRHLVFHYFHNCVYDTVWTHNQRRARERLATRDLIRTYNRDHRLVFVGDATMSPHELLQPGGSAESHNAEPGATWLQRLAHAFPKHVWLNPEPAGVWPYRQSIALVQQLLPQRMFPLTLQGLEGAMRVLSK